MVAVGISAALIGGLVFGCGWYLVDFMIDFILRGGSMKPHAALRAFRAGAIVTCIYLVGLIVKDPF